MYKINDDLIRYFKHNTNAVICIDFGEQANEIVPNRLQHENILNSFQIDEIILKYYYYPVSNILSDDEYLEIRHLRPKGNFYDLPEKHFLLRPYSVIFFGAYYRLDNLLWKFDSILSSKKFSPKINGREIEYLEQLKPYLLDYAKGFEEGFNKFEKNEIEPYLTILADKQDVATKVFEYATRNLITQSYFSARGFAMSGDCEIKGGFDEGLIQGYYYRAWSIILSNSQSFLDYFKDMQLSYLSTKQVSQSLQLTLKQIALKYVYENQYITDDNKNKIAEEFGHTSGHKLKQYYDFYYKRTNRIYKEETRKKLENKIELFEKVKDLLNVDKQQIEDEISVIKTKLETEY